MKKEVKQFNKIKSLRGKMRLAAESWDKPWKILISTIMSARTRDETTIPTAEKLFLKYTSIKKLSNAKLSDIKKIIKPVNFYKNKSRNILSCARVLDKDYNGIVPTDFNKLINLPGVGRKTANVFLSEIGKDEIGIDTHVSYISNYLDWTNSKKQEKVEQDLKKLFPKKYWKNINPVLVKFGKKYTSRKEKNELLDEIKLIN